MNALTIKMKETKEERGREGGRELGRKGGRKEGTHTHTHTHIHTPKRLLGLQSAIYIGSEDNKHLIVLTSCRDCREQSSPDPFGDTKNLLSIRDCDEQRG